MIDNTNPQEVNPQNTQPAAPSGEAPKTVDTGVRPVQEPVSSPPPASENAETPAPPPAEPAPAEPAPQNPAPQSTEPSPAAMPPVEGGGQVSEEDKAKVMAMRAASSQKKRTFTWLFLIIAAFFILFGGLVIFLLSQGDAETNPFLKMLGIKALNRQEILLTLSNIGFGFLVFVTFLISIINLFKSGFAKKDPLKRRKSIIIAGVSGVLLIMLLFGWVFTYFYLSQGLTRETKPQVNVGIKTEPENPINLTAPVTIKFDASEIQVDTKAYTLLSHTWDFGDKNTGTGIITSHTYETKGDGEYEVILTVKALEKATQTTVEEKFKTIISIQNEQVLASFSADPEKGDTPLSVKFDASASKDPDGEIIAYEWDFDEDGEFDDAEGVTVEHEFVQLGKYKIVLRVTDNNNEHATAEKDITVETTDKVTGVIEIEGQPETLVTFDPYSFSAEESGSKFGVITKYTWDFGDGSDAESGKVVDHAYQKAGTFEVVLSLEDALGNKGTETMTVTVGKAAGAPVPVIESNPAAENGIISGNLPLTVSFDATESNDPDNDIVEYEWDLNGDGKVDKSGSKVSYTYDEVGSFKVRLNVKDSTNKTAGQNLTVKVFSPGLQAKLTADKIEGHVPLKVKFDASGSSYYGGKIVSYRWDFGDGTPELVESASITHEYNKIGSFEVKVTAIASDGKRAEAVLNINIRPVPLQACFEMNNVKGPAPLIVTFDPRCSTGAVEQYKWDFGYDDQTSRQRKPTHTFEEPGEYEVHLEARDKNDNISDYKKTIVVTGTINQ